MLPEELRQLLGRPLGRFQFDLQDSFKSRLIPRMVHELNRQLLGWSLPLHLDFLPHTPGGGDWTIVEDPNQGLVVVFPWDVWSCPQEERCPLDFHRLMEPQRSYDMVACLLKEPETDEQRQYLLDLGVRTIELVAA